MSTREPTATTVLRLGKGDHGRLLTSEEFAEAVYEEPWKYERVDGRLVVIPPDGAGHVAASNPWLKRLFVYQAHHPDLIDLIVPNAWVRVDDGKDRIGDIGVYLGPAPTGLAIPDRVPDLMFEIVSEGTTSRRRDYVEKRADYHKLGVREYVIVDNCKARVTVLEHEPGGYRERALGRSDTYESPLLPGLAIALGEVLPA